MEVRKVFKTGNSLVISLPLTMLKALNLKDGSHVSLEVNREQRELIVKPVIVKSDQMSIDFVRIVNKLLIDCEPVLRRLSQ
jgi:antitoxin component of MazEF toxin-antitoxin module